MALVNDDQFGELAGRLRKSGGFTFDPRTGTFPAEGVSVSDVGAEKVHGEAGVPELKRYVMRHTARLSEEGAHLGGWASAKSGEDPRDVLDVSAVIPAHPRGHHIAEVHNRMHVNRQDAAYDLGRDVEIPNPRYPYTKAEKKYQYSDPDEYGSQVRIVRPAKRP